MYAITMDGLFWNQSLGRMAAEATVYPTWDEAVEAAQEDAKLPQEGGWTVVSI